VSFDLDSLFHCSGAAAVVLRFVSLLDPSHLEFVFPLREVDLLDLDMYVFVKTEGRCDLIVVTKRESRSAVL
jgi:hypothetical protein